jgi:hypothetical protein
MRNSGARTPAAIPARPSPTIEALARRRALRAVLAGAALGIAGFATRRPEPASAVSGAFTSSTQGTPALGATGTNGADGVDASSDTGYAVSASTSAAKGVAILGQSSGAQAVGVSGTATGGAGIGVSGSGPATGIGVAGGGGVGVQGFASPGGVSVQGGFSQGIEPLVSAGIGVQGWTAGGTNAQAPGGFNAGVQGINQDSGPAVFGFANGGGYGVLGTSSGAGNGSVPVGVLAISTSGYAFQGYTNTAAGVGAAATNAAPGGCAFVANATASSGGGMGAYANCASPQGIGLAAYATGGGLAAYIGGSVFITGSLMVAGPKNAVVRDAAGSLRRMYSNESPESWFEDAGSGRLATGAARVDLPVDFAELVRTDDYHVFLTPHGPSEGLYVSARDADGFTVHEQRGGTSDVGFSWRIMARRKDITGSRLERVDDPPAPALPEPAEVSHVVAAIQSSPAPGRGR